jgi:MFS family permease
MFALFYLNASFLQYAFGFGVLRTGLGILPLTIPLIVGARHVGRLSGRIGVDATIALAFVFVGGGLLGLSTSHAYPNYAGWLVVTGIGVTLALPTLSAVIAGSLPPAQAGVGTGLQATTRELGSAIGVAVIGTVLNARTHPGPHGVIASFPAAADTGLRVVGLAVLLLGALVVLPSRRTGPSGGVRVSPPAEASSPASM